MKHLTIIAFLALGFVACKSKKVADDPSTYPKDIALKPDNKLQSQEDARKLSDMREKINKLSSSEACTNENDWRVSPVGSKACGGPAAYIAYPKSKEDSIIPIIQNYTSAQSAFNQKYNIVSDCMMVEPPAGVRCVDGKAMLVNSAALQTTEN